MKKDEKIMLQHAISGKFGFGNGIDISEGLTKPQEMIINHDKKEIIIKSYDGAFDLKGLEKYKDYLLLFVLDDVAILNCKVEEVFND